MSDEDLKKELIKAGVNAAAEVGKEAYADGPRGLVRELGDIAKTAGSVLRLVSRPLKLVADAGHEIWDRLDARVRQRLHGVPDANIIEPPTYITAPLLQAYAFADDAPELRALFEQLLASAMNVDMQSQIHPAFVEKIKQMTPSEARIIRLFRNMEAWVAIQVNGETPGVPGFSILGHATAFAERACLADTDWLSVERCVVNLETLGLLTSTFERYLTPTEPYDEVRSSAAYRALLEDAQQRGKRVEDQLGAITLTALGRAFLHACTTDADERNDAVIDGDAG